MIKGYQWLVIAAAAMGAVKQADGCAAHWLTGKPEPTGIWPTTASAAESAIMAQDSADDAAITNAIMTPAVTPTIDTYVNSWLVNTNGATGRSTNATINSAISTIPANVQQVRYTNTNVYIQATGIPDYNIGPFGNNPNIPSNDNATFDIPRSPHPATGTHTATGLGAIGVLINGVDVFNMSDANSFQNKNVWHNNAGVVEAPSFDAANAHPQQQGVYHNHENPVSLINEIGASSTNPMVIGFAIDGYPILNDYASLTPGGPILKMTSSYQLRTYTNNIRGNGGPNVSPMFPDGYFEEDYQYVAGSGVLDQYNGAFVYTAQFPSGTYAYFATTDDTGAPAYPYLVGPQYYGVPSSDDTIGGTVIVPADSLVYTVPEPASLSLLAVAPLLLKRRRRV